MGEQGRDSPELVVGGSRAPNTTVSLLGRFEVRSGGEQITIPPGLPSLGLKFLAVHGGRVRTDALAEALWPEMGPAEARIFRRKNTVPLAALPATRTGEVLDVMAEVYPQFVAAPNVLYTSLNNMGAVFHPALTLLNSGWIERTQGDFQFYVDGVTRSTAHMLEVIDRERVTVAAALGIRAQTAQEWLATAYSATGRDLYEAMHDNPGYQGISAPRSLRHRYIFEEIPCSLIPITELGKQYGVDTPTICAMTHLANVVHGKDYHREGRTLERMGIKGMSVGELHHYVDTGER